VCGFKESADSCSSCNQGGEKANKLFFYNRDDLNDFMGEKKAVLNPLAGKPAPKSMLINVLRLNQKEVTSDGMETE
jgi:hypothetical protein